MALVSDGAGHALVSVAGECGPQSFEFSTPRREVLRNASGAIRVLATNPSLEPVSVSDLGIDGAVCIGNRAGISQGLDDSVD